MLVTHTNKSWTIDTRSVKYNLNLQADCQKTQWFSDILTSVNSLDYISIQKLHQIGTCSASHVEHCSRLYQMGKSTDKITFLGTARHPTSHHLKDAGVHFSVTSWVLYDVQIFLLPHCTQNIPRIPACPK